MALVGLGEALNLFDVIPEIVEADLGEVLGGIRPSRFPTLGEAATTTVGAAGTFGLKPTIDSFIKRPSTMHRRISTGGTGSNKKRKINSQAASNITTFKSSSNMAQSNGTNGEEVAVVPPPKRIAKTAPDYFTINLPFYQFETITSTTSATGEARSIRLNSIWDPLAGFGTIHQPLGRDTWAGIYDYYRVLKTNVKLTFINHDPGDRTTVSGTPTLLVGWEETDDNTSAGITQSAAAFAEAKATHHQIIAGKEFTSHNATVMTYSYTPESWDNHVQSTGVEERWTPIGDNPATNHYLTRRIFPAALGSTPRTYDMECIIEVTYTVQFRELKFSVFKTADNDE